MDSAPELPSPNLRSTIHIGASSISMLVVDAERPTEVIEFLEQPFPLARDVFGPGKVLRPTATRGVEILLGFLETLRELGLGADQVARAVATNILAEASNHEVFLNRLNIACGIDVEILDDGEMTRLIYLKTRRRLLDTPSMKKRTTLVVHVGPGNTRALLFKRGRIVRYTSYRLGTHRTGVSLEATNIEGPSLLRLITEHTSGQINQMQFDYRDEVIEGLVVIGYEIQLLTPFLSKGASRCTLRTLRALAREAAELSREEQVRRYQLDYHTSEAILPALDINRAVAEAFGLTTLRIPDSDYERGLLRDLPVSPSLTSGFQAEVMRSARILASEYKADAKHSAHVAFLCQRLFEETRDLHHLSEHDALLLNVASILHEVGGFISPKAHHKHSQYIIQNSEVFGLGRLDVQVIALVARYHRQSGPKTSHPGYRSLGTHDRIRVSKLASLIRVADALERTHSQRVRDVDIRETHSKLRISLKGVSDAAVERLAMQGKGDLFQDVFGLEIALSEQG